MLAVHLALVAVSVVKDIHPHLKAGPLAVRQLRL